MAQGFAQLEALSGTSPATAATPATPPQPSILKLVGVLPLGEREPAFLHVRLPFPCSLLFVEIFCTHTYPAGLTETKILDRSTNGEAIVAARGHPAHGPAALPAISGSELLAMHREMVCQRSRSYWRRWPPRLRSRIGRPALTYSLYALPASL